jgi:nitroreductase
LPDLSALIKKRQSTRTPFDPKRVIPKKDLREVLEAARWAPTAHNMQNFEVILVDDPQLLESIGAICGSVSETFIRENYQQLSFSEEELKKKKVGILGTMFPPSWRTPGVPPRRGPDAEPSSQTRLVGRSAALLVVLYDPRRRAPASEGDFLGIMSLGCVMQNMWLMASALGIGFQILSALSADDVEGEVKRILGVPGHFKIAFSARLGYPFSTPAYLRVRRDVEDFAHHDHYGNMGLGSHGTIPT